MIFSAVKNQRHCTLMGATLLLMLGAALPHTAAQAQSAPAAAAPRLDRDSIVKTAVIANTTAIKPGQKFLVGVTYTMLPEWHIYWKNPGDSGKPTSIRFTLPEGITAGDVQYPAPIRFMSEGDLMSFGYEKEVTLFAEMTAGDKLPESGSVDITINTDWLMCSDRCIPNRKELKLTLPIGEGKPANQIAFARYQAQVPSSGKLPEGVSAKVSTEGNVSTFTVTIKPADGEKLLVGGHGAGSGTYFYPAPGKDHVLEVPTVEGKKSSDGKTYEGPVTVKWAAEGTSPDTPALKKLQGTLTMQTASGKPVLLDIDQAL